MPVATAVPLLDSLAVMLVGNLVVSVLVLLLVVLAVVFVARTVHQLRVDLQSRNTPHQKTQPSGCVPVDDGQSSARSFLPMAFARDASCGGRTITGIARVDMERRALTASGTCGRASAGLKDLV